MLNRLFHLDQYRTTARREIAAGVTTYKLLSGRFNQLRPAVAVLAVLFVVEIVLLGT